MIDKIQLITVGLPVEYSSYRPEPFPGSEQAFIKGCTCPQLQPWPGRLTLSSDCPVHTLKSMKS